MFGTLKRVARFSSPALHSMAKPSRLGITRARHSRITRPEWGVERLLTNASFCASRSHGRRLGTAPKCFPVFTTRPEWGILRLEAEVSSVADSHSGQTTVERPCNLPFPSLAQHPSHLHTTTACLWLLPFHVPPCLPIPGLHLARLAALPPRCPSPDPSLTP